MELSNTAFVLDCKHDICENPTKLNGYECICNTHMRTVDACTYSSITTVSLLDIPKSHEELIVFIAKLKSEIDVLNQAFSNTYALYKLNQK